jgi:hypothetical protein
LLNYKKVTLNIIISLMFILSLTISLTISNGSWAILTFAIFISILLMKAYKGSQPVFIMFTFFMLYVIFLIPYFYFGVNITYYTEYRDYDVYTKTLIYHTIFLVLLYIFSYNKNIFEGKITDKLVFKNSTISYSISILLMVFIIIFGKTGNSILETGGYGRGGVGGFLNLAIYEYFYIFVITAFVFSNKNPVLLRLVKIIAIVYALKSLLYGNRIEVLQIGLLLFILFYEKKFSTLKIIMFGLMGYLFFDIFGIFRQDISLFMNNMKGYEIFKLTSDRGFVSSNQGDVFYSSAVMISAIEYGIYDIIFRVKSFISFISQIFLPSRFTSVNAQLSVIVKDLANTGGGGLISIYFYFWGGIVGILVIAKYISSIVQKVYTSKNQFLIIYGVMVLTTYPRWFAYGPIALFKLSGYVIVVYFIFNTVFYSIESKMRSSKKVI